MNVSLESIIGLLKSLKIKAGTVRQKVKLDTADILGSIHASSDTVEPEGRKMKQCSIKVLKFAMYISPLHLNLYIALHLQGDSKYVHVQ